MKRIYFAPQLHIMKVNAANMIAASITSTNVGVGYGGDTESAGITCGNVKGNSNNVWNDDWAE